MIQLIVYNILLLLFSPLAILYILWGLVLSDKSRGGMGERLGWISRQKRRGTGPTLWLHAVSVGESVAAKPIWEHLQRLLPDWRCYYSTTTDTGQQVAKKLVGPQGTLLYFPFDFLPCVWLALRQVRPDLIVLVETELWPNYLAVSHLMGCKIMIVNGRISERSLRGASWLRPVYRWMTSNVDRFCMQSEEDAARIIRLGADPSRVIVVGNSKYDQVHAAVSLGDQVKLRDDLGLRRNEPVVVAGSTHPGEEEILLSAFRHLKADIPTARLIMAPRDINRAVKVEELTLAHGFTVTRRTKMTGAAPHDTVIILDTIGELARAYALCTVAFVGGSLVPLGGHNVLEPLLEGKPVVLGPHNENIRDIAALTLEAEIGFQVTSAAQLADQWQRFLTDPARCQEIVRRAEHMLQHQAGASVRCGREAAHLLGLASPSTADHITGNPAWLP